ncbi:MAG: SEC-C domain-containing protein [Pseudomonadota bacterium]
MKKIGRNDLCPCGSGRKFKKCHMGREEALALDDMGEITPEMSCLITDLPEVRYGRSGEILDALDIKEITGNAIGVKLIDLKAYTDLNLFGGSHFKAAGGKGGGVFINLFKTLKSDPDNIYLAISPDIDDSTLIHELAHVLDYLGGSRVMPGTMEALGFELGVPVDHLEHPEEFGHWLEYLRERFDVPLDADDTIISYLYRNKILIEGQAIHEKNRLILKSKSDRIFKFLSENSQGIDALIRSLPGYIGARTEKPPRT